MEMWVMGVRVRVACGEQSLLEAWAEALSAWKAAGPGPMRSGNAPPEIQIQIHGRRTAGSAEDHVSANPPIQSEPSIEVDGPSLRLVGRGVSAVADATSRRATCVVYEEAPRDAAQMAADLIDPILLFLLTRSGRVPIHAAGVLVGDTGVVLAGGSGVGKSTLALAALEAGLPILSDDAVYVQVEPAARVWGYPRPIRVEGTGRAFSDTAGRQPVSRRPIDRVPVTYAGQSIRNGKSKAALLPPLGSFALAADRGALCLLTRGDRAAIRPIGADEALDRVRSTVDPGFDHFLEDLPAVVNALAVGGCWDLTVSPDLGQVLGILQSSFLRGGGSQAASISAP